MSEIKDIISQIEPPKSVWLIREYTNYRGNKMVKFDMQEQPDIVANSDLEALVIANQRNDWIRETGTWRVDADNTYCRVREDIRAVLLDVYEEQCKALHPTKTKIGKWLHGSDFLFSTQDERVIVELWKYVYKNRTDNRHMENAFKILKALHEKYKDTYPVSRLRRWRIW